MSDRPRFLVVDDDAVIRLLVSTILEELGEVVEAADGIKALQVLTRQHIDLVILDVMMPKMSGLQVLQAIRADEVLTDLPVCLLSARDQPVDKIAGYRAGADSYITKPFDTEMLLVVAQGLLADRNPGRTEMLAQLTDVSDTSTA